MKFLEMKTFLRECSWLLEMRLSLSKSILLRNISHLYDDVFFKISFRYIKVSGTCKNQKLIHLGYFRANFRSLRNMARDLQLNIMNRKCWQYILSIHETFQPTVETYNAFKIYIGKIFNEFNWWGSLLFLDNMYLYSCTSSEVTH